MNSYYTLIYMLCRRGLEHYQTDDSSLLLFILFYFISNRWKVFFWERTNERLTSYVKYSCIYLYNKVSSIMGKTTGLSCISFLPKAKHFHVPRESQDSIYRKTGMEPLLDNGGIPIFFFFFNLLVYIGIKFSYFIL